MLGIILQLHLLKKSRNNNLYCTFKYVFLSSLSNTQVDTNSIFVLIYFWIYMIKFQYKMNINFFEKENGQNIYWLYFSLKI